jgi:hypothetical protein
MALLIVRKKKPYTPPQTTRQFYFERCGNCLPLRKLTNSSRAVSALAQSRKITASESALPKTKNLKPTVINTYKKTRGGLAHFPIYVPRGTALGFRIVSRPDQVSG